MDKEEILARSREEHKNGDFVEAEALRRAQGIALGIGMIICGLLSTLRAIFKDSAEFAALTVEFGTIAAMMLVMFKRMGQRRQLLLGLVYAGFALAFFVLYLHLELGAF